MSMAAACGSLQHIFDNTLPDKNPSLIDSLSSPWSLIKPVKPFDHSFTEIFGELHFRETSPCPSRETLVSSSKSDKIGNQGQDDSKRSVSSDGYYRYQHKRSESLQLCTEGLGFESLDDAEDMKMEFKYWQENSDGCTSRNYVRERGGLRRNSAPETLGFCADQCRRQRINTGRMFPPPISCIGRTGKPWVCFESYREDGRFVLKEVRIPTQEFLHAYREDGRLRLSYIQPEDNDNDNDNNKNDNMVEQEEDDDDDDRYDEYGSGEKENDEDE